MFSLMKFYGGSVGNYSHLKREEKNNSNYILLVKCTKFNEQT